MSKITNPLIINIISGIIGSIVTVGILAVFGWLNAIIQLPSKVEENTSRIQKLDQSVNILHDKYLIIATAVETKFGLNLPELIKLSEEKKLPQKSIQTTLRLMGSSPASARKYLQDQLKFTPNEINTVFKH